jgi:hypothetical protein
MKILDSFNETIAELKKRIKKDCPDITHIFLFDFEVFRHDWLVCFYDIMRGTKRCIVNDAEELKKFRDENKQCPFVGFNCRSYDRNIMRGILSGYDAFEVSCNLVEGKGDLEFNRGTSIICMDVMGLISTGSLKVHEARLGQSIIETPIPFDIDRKLTDAELKEVEQYCWADVRATAFLLKERYVDIFESAVKLAELRSEYMKEGFDPYDLGKTKAFMSSVILRARPRSEEKEPVPIADTIRIKKYKPVLEHFQKLCKEYNPLFPPREKLETEVAGIPAVFGVGGMHAAPNHPITETGRIISLDVASMYPAIMIEYGFLSRAVPKADLYREMRDLRIKYKKEKNPLQQPLKIVLNSTYGASGDKFNDLYDPVMSVAVPISGQLLLLDFIEKIEPYVKLLQANTDGVFFTTEDEAKVDAITKEWEKRSRLEMEKTIIKKLVQRDVNNYLALFDDGSVKAKGTVFHATNPNGSPAPIVVRAARDFLLYGKDIEKTIDEGDRLLDFCVIFSRNKTTACYLYGDKRIYNKTVRFVADEEGSPLVVMTREYKTPEIDGKRQRVYTGNEKPSKSTLLPKKVKLLLDSVDKSRGVELDITWYVEQTKKIIKDYTRKL